MKRFLALTLTLIMLLATFTACGGGGNEPEATTLGDASATTTGAQDNYSKELYVGYGRANITPRYEDGSVMPVPLAGYPDKRIANTIFTDLFTSCTAFRDAEGDTVLFYTVDNEGLPTTIAADMQGEIKKATGIPIKNIFLTASHSHTAPSLGHTEYAIAQYKTIIYNGLIEAGKAAIADLTLCTELYAGTLDGTGLNFIRRYVTDGQGQTKHEIDGDHSMPVVRFVREGKKDVILANWAAHCDTVVPVNKYAISGDFHYYFMEKAEADLNAHVSIYNAASGDVVPFSKIASENRYRNTRMYGRALADVLINNISSLTKLDIKSDVSVATTTVRAEIDHSKDHMLEQAQEIIDIYYSEGNSAAYSAKCREYGIENINEANKIRDKAISSTVDAINVSAVTIGNIAFASAPYEILADTGMNIKTQSPYDLTFVLGYTNGKKGYIPPEYAYENGGYEVYVSLFVKGTAEKIQGEISKLINRLYNT